MVRVYRTVRIAVLLSASLSLAGCGASGGSFDPTDLLSGDFLSNKTPLAGDRKPVFPEGVPGVADGVPKELVKGTAESNVDQVAISEPAATPAQPARSQPSRPAPRSQTASKPAAPRTAAAAPPAARPPVSRAPVTRTAQPAAPAPASANSPAWPDPNAQRQRPQRPAQDSAPEPEGGQANWPPPDPNTFSR